MTKKAYRWPVIGVIFIAVFLAYSFNAMAYKDSESSASTFNTDKTDRTLIKEIYNNQKEMLALLKEIKGTINSSN